MLYLPLVKKKALSILFSCMRINYTSSILIFITKFLSLIDLHVFCQSMCWRIILNIDFGIPKNIFH